MFFTQCHRFGCWGCFGIHRFATCSQLHLLFFYVSPAQAKSSMSTSSASLGRIMNRCRSGCAELLKLDGLETLLGIGIVVPQTAYNWRDAVWSMLKLQHLHVWDMVCKASQGGNRAFPFKDRAAHPTLGRYSTVNVHHSSPSGFGHRCVISTVYK